MRDAPEGKFRPYERASEGVEEHHHYAKFMATGVYSGGSSYGRFLEPFPLKSADVFKALPQNYVSLGSYRFECFLFAGHKVVIHIEM